MSQNDILCSASLQQPLRKTIGVYLHACSHRITTASSLHWRICVLIKAIIL